MKMKNLLNEAVNPNKKYPIVVQVVTPEGVLPELAEIVADMVDDEELPKGTKLTVDMLTDDVMKIYVKGMVYLYDEGGSDDRRADNHYAAMEKTIKAAMKQRGAK